MGFEYLLGFGVLLTGATALFRVIFPKQKKNKVFKEIAGLFPILLIVFAGRSFAFEPFKIPSGSMKPVLFEGDFILIDKFSHGFRWPITSKRITQQKPKRGDIVVFRGKHQDKDSYIIKRIIGLPGDHIQYKDKRLYINGAVVEKDYLRREQDNDLVTKSEYPVLRYHEKLGEVEYDVYNYAFVNHTHYPFDNVTVPEGNYFVMGNNRDNSADSRYFGFLSDDKIVGHPRMIFFSYLPGTFKPRWDRIGKLQ